jgi:glycosyltransferase involved in cell wall biosynthesis
MAKKLGVLAYSTKTGLGYQTKSYVKHLNPSKVLEINLSPFNGKQQHNWFPDAQKVVGYPKDHELREFLSGLDTVLMAETPLNYNLYSIAREMGVRTVNVINWEFFDHIVYPNHPLPDAFIMPSMWYWDDAKAFADAHGVEIYQIHHPVDRDELPFRGRHTSKPLHIAGNPAVNDRNGTWDFMAACPDGIVTTQSDDLARHLRMRYRHCNVFTNVADYNELYNLGDVLVFPRRYGGNCLPLNEALSTGMPVIMPDISPNNHLLPPEWLVPATCTDSFTPRTKIEMYSVDIDALRAKIEWFRSADMAVESKKADAIAQSISWEVLKPRYLDVL